VVGTADQRSEMIAALRPPLPTRLPNDRKPL
jgi:hypothetical protein